MDATARPLAHPARTRSPAPAQAEPQALRVMLLHLYLLSPGREIRALPDRQVRSQRAYLLQAEQLGWVRRHTATQGKVLWFITHAGRAEIAQAQ